VTWTTPLPRALRLCALALGVAVTFELAPAPAGAGGFDPTLYRNGDTFLTPTLEFVTAYFAQHGAWGGNADEILGDDVRDWAEWTIEPGLEGGLSLGRFGVVEARLSGIGSWTRAGLDAAGSNYDDRRPGDFTLEDAYLGWRSGELFSASLGKDAIELSVGAQDYEVGSGFLFWDGGTDGGKRGAFWIGPNTAFAMTGIARLRTGRFFAEAVWLTPNDVPDDHTLVAGVNGEYAFGERALVGLGYWNVYDSDNPRRDGLHVIDLRGQLAPLRRLPDLVLSAELVREKNGRLNDSWGGYAEAAYTWASRAWQPHLSYRFSAFTGDDGGEGSEIEAFDPLFYGLDDWGTWYQGELMGEYVLANRNLSVHRLLARIQPLESLTVSLLYYHYRLEDLASELVTRLAPRAGDIEHRDLGDEVDLAVDWEVGEHLSLSTVLAIFEPGKGAEDFFEGDATWLGFMLAATVRF
jgi:hypothetical protein